MQTMTGRQIFSRRSSTASTPCVPPLFQKRSFDSSVVNPCPSLFPWARFQKTKGAIELHTLPDHDGYFPAFIDLTSARESDLSIARLLKLPAHSIVATDRGYVDFFLCGESESRAGFQSCERSLQRMVRTPALPVQPR